jgi:hypothetical protein
LDVDAINHGTARWPHPSRGRWLRGLERYDVPGRLLEASGDSAELLELRDATFDEMALGAELLVEAMLERTRGGGMAARVPLSGCLA